MQVTGISSTEGKSDMRLGARSMSIALTMAAVSSAPAARAADTGILVPAYFSPGTGGTEGYTDGWAQMAASAGRVPITAIFNPDGGPGPSSDPSYLSALSNLSLAGGKVIAYVDTSYGSIPITTVEGQISTYLAQYPTLIDGFFLDDMSDMSSEVSYYQAIYTFVKSLGSSFEVIGNPGTSTIQEYLSDNAADILVTFESSAAAFVTVTPPSWVYSYPAGSFANTIYAETDVSGMTSDISLAVDRNVGYIYVTDQTMNPPAGYLYDRLPSYWNQEVAAIAPGVPEPSSIVLLISGLLFSVGARKGWTLSAALWDPNAGAGRNERRAGASLSRSFILG